MFKQIAFAKVYQGVQEVGIAHCQKFYPILGARPGQWVSLRNNPRTKDLESSLDSGESWKRLVFCRNI
jgi:hypothetical protein